MVSCLLSEKNERTLSTLIKKIAKFTDRQIIENPFHHTD